MAIQVLDSIDTILTSLKQRWELQEDYIRRLNKEIEELKNGVFKQKELEELRFIRDSKFYISSSEYEKIENWAKENNIKSYYITFRNAPGIGWYAYAQDENSKEYINIL